jgi:tRNA threonylcarbamoyladenosine biosynthesis protein TsaB
LNVLGIDGALGSFSAAVARDASVASACEFAGNVALERGLEAVAMALADANVTPRELDRIAVVTGPGGFTGLRIAIAYAKSLAQAWRVGIVGVSSFDALEYGRDFASVLTIVSGRTGVISARLRAGSETRRASGLTGDVLDAVLATEAAGPLPVLNASKDVLAALGERGIVVENLDSLVRPAAAAAALAGGLREPAASLHEVRADYGERPAAKVPRLR